MLQHIGQDKAFKRHQLGRLQELQSGLLRSLHSRPLLPFPFQQCRLSRLFCFQLLGLRHEWFSPGRDVREQLLHRQLLVISR